MKAAVVTGLYRLASGRPGLRPRAGGPQLAFLTGDHGDLR